MCGRTSLFVPQPVLEERFGATVIADGGYIPRYNITPGDGLEVITSAEPTEIDRYHWGLLPHWADEIDDGFINARSESAHEKPAFKDAWKSRPCLVLTSGFYEWQGHNGSPKQPFRIYREDDPAFSMAGLWETTEVESETIHSVTILTTEANELIEPIHDRMPVILEKEDEQQWLRGDPADRHSLCEPTEDQFLDAYPISTTVNNPQNDDPDIILPAETKQSGLDTFQD